MKQQRRQMKHQWRPGADYRIVCDCQRHARRAGSVWRRVLRVASRATAVLVGVPVALAVFDIPTKAMNLTVGAAGAPAAAHVRKVETSRANLQRSLPIFTTETTREQFLGSQPLAHPRTFTFDSVKEEFFRTQVPYGSIIYREAIKNNLAPELVAAMVHTESDFRAGLVSNKSAQGLMQIVPSTARILGIANPFDPQQNIAAGTRYYRRLLNRFGDERLALAAYNAGEGNVERFGGIPPFAETQGYIEKVHSRTHRYRMRVRNTYIASTRVRTASVH
ncbi:MAG TPA: lytic transglycosylase domain-containing protein [Thermoanaerobaculia bacterium]